jgi:hypothetical protein
MLFAMVILAPSFIQVPVEATFSLLWSAIVY